MSCQDFETTLVSIARAQLLEAAARKQALAHIAQCDACADKLVEQQELTAAVRTTARTLAAAGASPAVEQALRSAFRAQTAIRTDTVCGNAPTRTWQWSVRWACAAAAVLLVALFGGWLSRGWLWQRARADQKTRFAATSPGPTIAPRPGDEPGDRFAPAPPVSADKRQVAFKPRQPRPKVPRRAPDTDDLAGGFIALAAAGELAPLESGQVLRVELSASTLLSMGLPILAEDVSKPVLAELLLGQDGMARAIRFVKPDVAANAGASQTATNR